jgi:histidinol phosphatase-like PHP family hydrolase
MGDLVNEARTASAAEDMRALRAEIEKAAPGTPLLAVPGNHDNDGDLVLRTFQTRGGVRELGGYRFVMFCDEYEDHQYCARSGEGLELIRDLAAASRHGRVAGATGGPIVALQHNPMDPVIEDSYPYMLSNRQEVLRGYEQAGVLLSISGHWHCGQPLHAGPGGVRYFTAPALCEQPFYYAIVTLSGREVAVEQRRLSLAGGPALWDIHVHTQFSYCGPTMCAADAVARARLFGLGGICLTEHAPQLYSTPEVFWSGRHIREPELWRSPEHSRMAAFRKAVEPLRSPFVRVGLEVELDAEGHLTILDEDRRWVDVLVGAVHFLPEDADALSDAALDRAVMRTNEGLLAAGVHVLAHPWRFHQGKKRRIPTDLYAPLADMLRQAGVAAEVNLHISDTDPAFIRACVERGAKLVFGSDAHEMWEPALLHRHLDLLRQAAGTDDVAGLMAVPG